MTLTKLWADRKLDPAFTEPCLQVKLIGGDKGGGKARSHCFEEVVLLKLLTSSILRAHISQVRSATGPYQYGRKRLPKQQKSSLHVTSETGSVLRDGVAPSKEPAWANTQRGSRPNVDDITTATTAEQAPLVMTKLVETVERHGLKLRKDIRKDKCTAYCSIPERPAKIRGDMTQHGKATIPRATDCKKRGRTCTGEVSLWLRSCVAFVSEPSQKQNFRSPMTFLAQHLAVAASVAKSTGRQTRKTFGLVQLPKMRKKS